MMHLVSSCSIRWLPLTILLISATLLPLFSPYPLLALVPGVAAIALLFIGNRPELGLYTIVFLIPFGNFRNIGGPIENLKIHWILALVLLIVVLFRLLADRSFLARFRSNLWPFFLGFLVVSLLSTLFSDYKANAGAQVALTLVAILFFALTISLVSMKGLTHHIPAVIAISVSLSSTFAVIGNVTGVSWFSEGETFSRSTGGTGDPNALAMQVIFGLPFLVFWLTHARHFSLRVLAAAMIVINVAAMVGTFSRSGALVLAACALVLVVINIQGIRPQKLGLLLIGGAAVIMIAGVSLPQSFWERQASLFSAEQDRSLNRRASYLDVARDAIAQRPLLGHGPGTFRDLYALTDWAQFFHRKGSTKRRYAHNTYVEVLVGTGLLGAAFYFGLLGSALRNFIKTRQRLIALGDTYHKDLVTHYLVAFGFLLLYMSMFSDVYQKFMLLCLGLSQLWYRYATEAIPGADPRAMPVAIPGPEPGEPPSSLVGIGGAKVAP
jgi:putative inorganic carbon (HCO3(-)) transporter